MTFAFFVTEKISMQFWHKDELMQYSKEYALQSEPSPIMFYLLKPSYVCRKTQKLPVYHEKCFKAISYCPVKNDRRKGVRSEVSDETLRIEMLKFRIIVTILTCLEKYANTTKHYQSLFNERQKNFSFTGSSNHSPNRWNVGV